MRGATFGPPLAPGGAGSPATQSPLQGPLDEQPWSGESDGVVTDPIDPRYLTEVPFGTDSFWVAPWRAYMDTWPAERLTGALGINFNVGPSEAPAVAQLLQDSGFKLARREIGWGALSYENPTAFTDEARIDAVLEALHDHGLRPLILLNANSGAPGPALQLHLETLAAAPAGAQTVKLSPASAAEVVPGKTGFDDLTFGGAPDDLITAVGAGGVATLSRPLPNELPAGSHHGTTLRYAPFQAPTLADGEPNPVFEETLAGWLRYVATVSRKAASIFGPDGYDLEIWNELGFGSQFLSSEHYYASAAQEVEREAAAGASEGEGSSSAAGEERAAAAEGQGEEAAAAGSDEGTPEDPSTATRRRVVKQVVKALLDATVAYVRDPANGISPAVGVSDGFASQTPFVSGAQAPVGLTALSKHPYAGPKVFPADYRARQIVPVDALGLRDTGTHGRPAPFLPSYQSLMPEAALTATSTETLIRDLAPFTTNVYSDPHGREVAPPGGAPVQKWITEYNLGVGHATPVGPDEVTPDPVTLTPADREHFEAKTVLRSLTATISKGATREYFFAAAPGALSLISPNFYTALQTHPGTYPGDQQGGETLRALHNLLTHLQGPGPQGQPRQLQLTTIAQEGNHAQFTGDGTPNHPNLYDRNVLAVLPFQTSPTSYAIPVYVMTRDLLSLYQPTAPTTDTHRFDLPNENFRITLTNLPPTTTPPTVTTYDTITNTTTPTQPITQTGTTATIQVTTTDYPRILTIDYTGQ